MYPSKEQSAHNSIPNLIRLFLMHCLMLNLPKYFTITSSIARKKSQKPYLMQFSRNKSYKYLTYYVYLSFIDVVQDSPRMGLGILVKTKKTPLSNQYTARGTAFRL